MKILIVHKFSSPFLKNLLYFQKVILLIVGSTVPSRLFGARALAAPESTLLKCSLRKWEDILHNLLVLTSDSFLC